MLMGVWMMFKRMTSVGVVVVSLSLAIATVFVINMLGNAKEMSPPHLTEATLQSGHLHHFYLADPTWRHAFSNPWSIRNLVDLRALGLMGAMVVGILLVSRRLRIGFGHPLVGLACLASAGVPYYVGVMIRAGNTDFSESGAWLATMLTSILYGSVACGLIAATRLMGRRASTRRAKGGRRSFRLQVSGQR